MRGDRFPRASPWAVFGSEALFEPEHEPQPQSRRQARRELAEVRGRPLPRTRRSPRAVCPAREGDLRVVSTSLTRRIPALALGARWRLALVDRARDWGSFIALAIGARCGRSLRHQQVGLGPASTNWLDRASTKVTCFGIGRRTRAREGFCFASPSMFV